MMYLIAIITVIAVAILGNAKAASYSFMLMRYFEQEDKNEREAEKFKKREIVSDNVVIVSTFCIAFLTMIMIIMFHKEMPSVMGKIDNDKMMVYGLMLCVVNTALYSSIIDKNAFIKDIVKGKIRIEDYVTEDLNKDFEIESTDSYKVAKLILRFVIAIAMVYFVSFYIEVIMLIVSISILVNVSRITNTIKESKI